MSDDEIDSMEAGRGEADEWTMLPGGEEKEEDDGDVLVLAGSETNDAGDFGGGGASLASNRVITATHPDVNKYLEDNYPLHLACQGGAPLDVIKYLVEEAGGIRGKELIGRHDYNDMYPLHLACGGGAPLDVIKYLVEADGNKGKEPLGKKYNSGMYPLHYACLGGAPLDVIKYLVEEADGIKGKELLGKKDNSGMYPLHLACERKGAPLDVIKYLVEEADGDKGKELLGKASNSGVYPLHLACKSGARAPLDVIKYLVEEADGDKGKESLGKADLYGMYPLHYACKGGAPLNVIKYLVEEADCDKGKEPLGKKDGNGRYPLHYACRDGASLDVIKYLIHKNASPLQNKDHWGVTALDFMNNTTVREIWGTHQARSVADKSSDIDRLNYLLYARALAYSARQAEQPESSLCIGLYGRWGGGKTTLWKQTKKCLDAEFLQADAQMLHNVCQLSGTSYHDKKAVEYATEPFKNAVKRVVLDPYVLNDTKKAWREKSQELLTATSPLPLTFMEHLVWLFLRIFCACQSCRRRYDDTVDNDVGNKDGVQTRAIQRIGDKSRDARLRRMEVNAIFFLIILFALSLLWIVYWPIYLTCCKDRETNGMGSDNDESNDSSNDDDESCMARCCSCSCSCSDEDTIRKEAKHIAKIITGGLDLGDGNAAHWEGAPCGTFFVTIILQIVRAIVSAISLACKALRHIMCFQWCCSETNHTPTGAVKYKFVEFNAWTYQGSDLLWASLMKDLWDAVEAEYGTKVVRYHRAGIELAEENQFDETHRTLTPEQKALNRKKALLMFRARLYLYLFLFLIVLTVLMTLTITNCNNDNRTCLGKINVTGSNATNSTTDIINLGKVENFTNTTIDIIEAVQSDSEEGGNEVDVLAAIIATVAAFCPLLASVIKYCRKVRPYTRQNQGDFILEHATESTKRKDFKEDLGFMGEVKTEIDYLFDLLKTETYPDKEIGCSRKLRLCVFVDDLDRCPPEIVVSVLEAVILLLVDGPISVWMAIDGRIVVQCIEAMKEGVFDEANISGHEFLDKIVQLPFSIPELTNDAKKSYLDKIIDEKELDPARVLARFMREGQRFLKEEDYDFEGHNILRHGKEYEGLFSPLAGIATELDEGGLVIPQHDRKAVIGMTESELIKIVAENPRHASAEHRENLCSIVLQATSELNNTQNESADYRQLTDMCSIVSKAIFPELRSPLQLIPGNSNRQTASDSADASDDFVLMVAPPSSLYLPMLNDKERDCLEDFIPFIDGNPRRMKRIINVFNVARRIIELQSEGSPPPQLTAKILKIVILIEQWPYRMAWLLQLIEDVNQMSNHRGEDSRMNQFLEECLGCREDGKSWWNMICSVGILIVYRKIVCKLLFMREVDSSNMVAKDSDPQLFEGLLQCNSHDENAITVEDLRPLGCNMESGEYQTCLRSYMFNMPQAVTDKVSVMMNKALINYVGKESSNIGESVNVSITGSEVGINNAHGTIEVPAPAFDSCMYEDDDSFHTCDC